MPRARCWHLRDAEPGAWVRAALRAGGRARTGAERRHPRSPTPRRSRLVAGAHRCPVRRSPRRRAQRISPRLSARPRSASGAPREPPAARPGRAPRPPPPRHADGRCPPSQRSPGTAPRAPPRAQHRPRAAPRRALTARGPSAAEAAHGADAVQLEAEAALPEPLLVQPLMAAARRLLQQPRPTRPGPRLCPRLPRLPRPRAAASAASSAVPLLLLLLVPLCARRLGRTRRRRRRRRRCCSAGRLRGDGRSLRGSPRVPGSVRPHPAEEHPPPPRPRAAPLGSLRPGAGLGQSFPGPRSGRPQTGVGTPPNRGRCTPKWR